MLFLFRTNLESTTSSSENGFLFLTHGGWSQKTTDVNGFLFLTHNGWSPILTPSIPPTTQIPSGGIGHGGVKKYSKRRKYKLVTLEINGKEYKIPYDDLQEFLDELASQKDIRKAIKEKKLKIRIKSAPIQYISQIRESVDRSNEILYMLWRNAVIRYMQDIEDEELLLLSMASWTIH